MKNIILIVVIAVTLGAGYWLFFAGPGIERATGECDRETHGLPPEAPLEMAAMFDRNCAIEFIEQSDRNAVELARTLGYPSLLFGRMSVTDIETLMKLAVDAGDRSFFEKDPVILQRLEDMNTSGGDLTEVIDFVASMKPSDELLEGGDITKRLGYLPIWQSTENANFLIQACAKVDCETQTTSCDGNVGLSDKLALAQGRLGLATLIKKCSATPERPGWLVALRRAGVVDTECSTALQISAALTDPETLLAGCFTKHMQPGNYRSKTSSDIVDFIHEWITVGRPFKVSGKTLEYIMRYFPKTAEFVATSLQPE
jgi:hypothetical protein